MGSNKGGEVISEALNIVQTFTGGFTLPSALGGLLSVDKWRVDKFGGFNSTYGFGITTTSRFENTFINTEGTPKFKANEKAKYIQKYNPFDENVTKYAPQSNDSPTEEGGEEESNEVSLDEIAENDQQEADNSENSEQ